MAITPGVSRTLRRDWITVSPCLRQSGQQMYGQLTCASPGPGPNIRRPFAHKCPSFPIGILEDTHTYIALDRDIHTISSSSSSRRHLTPSTGPNSTLGKPVIQQCTRDNGRPSIGHTYTSRHTYLQYRTKLITNSIICVASSSYNVCWLN